MSQSLCFSSDEFSKNMSKGLSSLQRNGQFVDMTLATDGYFVKVHQIVMALASPYIKEILSSIESGHPVIFLNKISHHSLCSLLEYIYTGEVMVSVACINDFMEAARALCIKGLDQMESYSMGIQQQPKHTTPQYRNTLSSSYDVEESYNSANDDEHKDPMEITHEDVKIKENLQSSKPNVEVESVSRTKGSVPDATSIQYTVTNHGNLQIILNRYLYYYKHNTKASMRQWRCADYPRLKCAAVVYTKDGMVVRRVGAHIHPFHDKKILKKLQKGSIFSAIHEAEKKGNTLKTKRKEDHATDETEKSDN